MDNVCNRCLFSIPSKAEMAEEQEYKRNIVKNPNRQERSQLGIQKVWPRILTRDYPLRDYRETNRSANGRVESLKPEPLDLQS